MPIITAHLLVLFPCSLMSATIIYLLFLIHQECSYLKDSVLAILSFSKLRAPYVHMANPLTSLMSFSNVTFPAGYYIIPCLKLAPHTSNNLNLLFLPYFSSELFSPTNCYWQDIFIFCLFKPELIFMKAGIWGALAHYIFNA